MSNCRRRRFVPSFDNLESRTVPAGNITASVTGGTLYFTGDDEANHISITGIGNGGVRIESGSDATTINGEDGPLVFWNVTKGIAGYLLGGDDQLTISNVDLKREIGLNLGDGNDYLLLDNVHAKKPSTIKGGDGDDVIAITDSSFRKELAIYANDGDDQVGIVNTRIGRHSRIDGGRDNDTFTAQGNKWGHNVKLENFQFKSSEILPTAGDDSATLLEGGQVDIDVAANDFSLLGQLDLTSIVIVDEPTNGVVTVNDDGTVTYVHDGSNTTSDSFTYTISNTNGKTSQEATVSITITPVNDPPAALNDTATVAEGGTVSINVASNDSDSDGTLALNSITIVQQPANGSVTVNNNGTVSYTHNGSETTTNTFTYTIKDNLGATSNTATVNITITPVNDPPVAVNDTATVDEGGSVIINVASNDTDPENSLDLTSIVIVAQPANGSVTVNNNGTVTYLHNNSNTTTDSFTYTIKDTQGTTSNTATVTITVTPQADDPIAVNDAANVDEGGNVVINLASNDSDPDGSLDLTTIIITQQPAHGSIQVNNDGTVTYLHDGSESTTDSFQYTIKDTEGNTSNAATVTVTIAPVNDDPVAVNDEATVAEGGNIVINLAGNDTDAENQLDLTSIVIVDQPANGSIVVNNDGTVSYTHNGSETTSDSFTYTIKDADGATSNTATVTITVTPQNDAPVAVDDQESITQGGSVVVNVAGNDTDADSSLDLNSIVITQPPANGTLSINGDGTITYTHNGSATTSDSFKYTINDQQGATSNEAQVNITITAGNQPPVAGNDFFSILVFDVKVFNLISNDTDDGFINPASIIIVNQPSHGSIIVNDNGTVTYMHNGSASPTDSFTYTITDNLGLVSNIATVTINIT
ncbi:MAG: tandem-95 repeat protein [Planctomycetia bacterium]|nr:tandem-95 repeat protein [Planctomycetia bacterium]